MQSEGALHTQMNDAGFSQQQAHRYELRLVFAG
jgi:hypothetical protein